MKLAQSVSVVGLLSSVSFSFTLVLSRWEWRRFVAERKSEAIALDHFYTQPLSIQYFHISFNFYIAAQL